MRARRKHSREFKVEAVRLVRERVVTVAQAARDLDLNQVLLRKWVREFGADPKEAFPGQGQQKPEDAEITRLRREVARLKMERDILKKPRPTSPRESMLSSASLRNTEGRGRWTCCARVSGSRESGSMLGAGDHRASAPAPIRRSWRRSVPVS
ncbi:MAG: hypothetical protein EXR95_05945 [Gemmatimonadetes bacterium]|nr:hypothetical protein [Gemmatimonadota bacterium]